MKLLIDHESYLEALRYAGLSLGYTHFHKGWDKEQDTLKQFLRIANGQIAQKFVVRLLRANGVLVEEDDTQYTDNDEFDFRIKGVSFDVKCSSHHTMPMQITLPAKGKHPDYFVFCRLSMDMKIIEVIGVVQARQATEPAYFVAHRQVVPNTKLVQQFEQGSYFYTAEYQPFDKIITWGQDIIDTPVRQNPHPAGKERAL
jgi:hypothetical protein